MAYEDELLYFNQPANIVDHDCCTTDAIQYNSGTIGKLNLQCYGELWK
jgi:hypothetical protein